MFDFSFAKTNRVPAATETPQVKAGVTPAVADETQASAAIETLPSQESYQTLINGGTAQPSAAAIDQFLADAGSPSDPSVNNFRPIHVPDLWKDIYSQFPKRGSKSPDIPYRSIILKYDALVRTFKAMKADMYRMLKGGRLNAPESKAVYERMKQLDWAATQAEQFQKQVESDYQKQSELEQQNANQTQQA